MNNNPRLVAMLTAVLTTMQVSAETPITGLPSEILEHMPVRNWEWSKDKPTDWFTVYDRWEFARAALIEVYAIANSGRQEVPKLAGVLSRDETKLPDAHRFKANETNHYVQTVVIGSGWERNWMGDQFADVTFNDGSRVRYTMPRDNKLVRDREDVWIRARFGKELIADNQLTDYPEQLFIIRPRVEGDTKFDRSYAWRMQAFNTGFNLVMWQLAAKNFEAVQAHQAANALADLELRSRLTLRSLELRRAAFQAGIF